MLGSMDNPTSPLTPAWYVGLEIGATLAEPASSVHRPPYATPLGSEGLAELIPDGFCSVGGGVGVGGAKSAGLGPSPEPKSIKPFALPPPLIASSSPSPNSRSLPAPPKIRSRPEPGSFAAVPKSP